jgi:tetratricopeptide (TPR) repeat protein
VTIRHLAPVLALFLVAVSLSVLVLIVPPTRRAPPAEKTDPRYEQFLQMADGGSRTEALARGDTLFQSLLEEKPDHPDLDLLRRRLEAARQLRTLLASTAKSSPAALLEGVTDPGLAGLPVPVPPERTDPGTLLPPAREAYWTRLKLFAAARVSRGLSVQQVAFLDRYYDLHMQDEILAIGRQALVAHSGSSERLCYALVLPLLYLQGRQDAWDQETPLFDLFTPQMLGVLSKFALLQAERPGAALAVARCQARRNNREFSPTQWASDAVDACTLNQRPDLAEQLVGLVSAGTERQGVVAGLRLKVADSYARCGEYGPAAQACERICAELPATRWYGRIMVAYLGYLARDGKIEQVIATTESVLQDARCQPYRAQILYLRWWALRKSDRLEEASALAQQLLEQYADNPAVAPVLLERATDALARQKYDQCRELLTRLTREFPGTESARRAQDILTRLTNSAGT